MKEKLIIIFIASILGLLVTTAAFYIYQSTKKMTNETPSNITTSLEQPIEPTPEAKLPLNIETPLNESIVDRRTIEIKGNTNPSYTVIVSSNTEDNVVKPASDGSFTLTINISTGINKIVTRAIAPTGETITDERIVTYSTEEF